MIPRNLLDSITPDQCRAYLEGHEDWTPGKEWALRAIRPVITVTPWLHTEGHEVLVPSVATADWLSRCAEVIMACAAVEGRCECEVTKAIARGGADPLPSAEAWAQALNEARNHGADTEHQCDMMDAWEAGYRDACDRIEARAAEIDEEATQ